MTLPWLEILTFLAMLVSLLGLLVPLFPGIFVMWLAALVYGLFHGFSLLGGILFGVCTLLMIAGEWMDNLVMGASARKAGASWWSIGLAFVAGVVGTVLLSPLGGLIAAPLSVLLLEYVRQRDWRRALAVVKSIAVGWGQSFVVRLGIGVVLLGLWVIWAWQG
jgi:uncharacterized protein